MPATKSTRDKVAGDAPYWSCDECTFHNPDLDSDVCAMCGETRWLSGTKKRTAGAGGGGYGDRTKNGGGDAGARGQGHMKGAASGGGAGGAGATEPAEHAAMLFGTKGLDEAALTQYFSQFGDVATSEVFYDQKTGKSRGFGKVIFMDASAAAEVVDQKHHSIGSAHIEAKCPRRGVNRYFDEQQRQQNHMILQAKLSKQDSDWRFETSDTLQDKLIPLGKSTSLKVTWRASLAPRA